MFATMASSNALISELGGRTDILDAHLPPVEKFDGEPLTESQWTTLMSIVDAFIPAIQAGDHLSKTHLTIPQAEYDATYSAISRMVDPRAPEGIAKTYLEERASDAPMLRPLMHRLVADYVRKAERDQMSLILTTLGTRAGSLLLTGSATPFHEQPVNYRHQTLVSWMNSYIPPLRAGAKLLGALSKSLWIKTSPAFPKLIGFPRIPIHGNVGQGYNFEFIQIPPGTKPEEIETDVVIVGSGCGAAVAAKNIAEAGHRVLVLEKMYHFGPEHLPMSEATGGVHLFENGGINFTDDGSLLVLTGAAWGGGGTINWSASLQPQEFVRREWSEKDGLPFFTSGDFQNSLDRVCERMGVTSDLDHNKTNQILLDGAKKLGYSAKVVPQNNGGTKHYCGYCTFGCGSCEKQGPAVSWLPDAHKAGAKFIEGISVDRVLFETVKGKKKATGVVASWLSRDRNGGVSGPVNERTTRKVIIRAKRVIVSGGSLQSPLLLLRSGLKNPQIGRNLHLHPVLIPGCIWDKANRPWEGGILTTVVNSLENLDGAGHGPKLEALTMMPSVFLPIIPWLSGTDFKKMSAEFGHTSAYISLVRDRDTGRIYPDPHDGKVRIDYTPSAHTRQLALEGLISLCKLMYIEGARRIFTNHQYVPDFIREDIPEGAADPGINDTKFQEWLALIRKKGVTTPDTTFGSAHQMGSCRMSSKPKAGVVDPKCRVWGTRGLYVMDASVFPSASGVNPMVTNMAITDHTSRILAKELTDELSTGVRAKL